MAGVYWLVAISLLGRLITADRPIAEHSIIVVEEGSSTVIRLTGHDKSGANYRNERDIKYTIDTVPGSGALYQLSQVYSEYGYNPIKGTAITSGNQTVTGTKNRVYYARPSPDPRIIGKWGTFSFTVDNGMATSGVSYPGTVTLVSPSGIIAGSQFLLDSENWNIKGNKAVTTAKHQPYSNGPSLNHYIMGTDDKINVGPHHSDVSLWYFSAPVDKFSGNFGIAYGGSLDFVLAGFSGDFQNLNPVDTPLVILTCDECPGPQFKGITLVYPLSASKDATSLVASNGKATRFSLPLREDGGWLKDPQNTQETWGRPSQCDLISVMSRLSSVRILGDWTTWYETMALDNVHIVNKKSALPVCAQKRPDASVCTCA